MYLDTTRPVNFLVHARTTPDAKGDQTGQGPHPITPVPEDTRKNKTIRRHLGPVPASHCRVPGVWWVTVDKDGQNIYHRLNMCRHG